jgi:hypothetical protein
MRGESDADAVDFKPFFDMIVGVLFIVLILISAQMFFAQRAVQEASATEPQRRALRRQSQIDLFLTHVADRMRTRGLSVQVDHIRSVIAGPLPELRGGHLGAPRFDEALIRGLGEELSAGLQCVGPSPTELNCPALDLLKLGAVHADVVVAGLSPDARLSPDRYAQLVGVLFSAAILSGTPELLAVTGAGGVPAVRFGSATEIAQPQITTAHGAFRLLFLFEQ